MLVLMNEATGRNEVVGMRLTGELGQKFDAFRARMQRKMPRGLTLSQTDALRIIIKAGLDALERRR